MDPESEGEVFLRLYVPCLMTEGFMTMMKIQSTFDFRFVVFLLCLTELLSKGIARSFV